MTRCKINNEEMVIKGIDEIPMFSWNTETKEFYVLGHKFDGVNSIEDFVDFINNLQQENEKLKEENNRLKHLPKQMEQYILSEMYVNREVVAGWLQFDKLLKMIGWNNENI